MIDLIRREQESRLSRWLKLPWPPGWGWGSWVRGCGCCKSSAAVTITSPCCTTGGLPTTLHVTLAITSGTCAALDGQTFALTWDAVAGNWDYDFTDGNGCPWMIVFGCLITNNFNIRICKAGTHSLPTGCGSNPTHAAAACGALNLSFTGLTVGGNSCATCLGGATFTATATL